MSLTLSQKLKELAHHCKGRKDISMLEVVEFLGPSADAALIVVFSLPFVLFLPFPGLSTIFGLLIIFYGFRVALKKNLWLPKFIREKRFSGDWFSRHVCKASTCIEKLERWIRPRGTIYQKHPFFQTFNGWILILAGFFLMIPLPPGTNFLPGVTAFLISLGVLEEDLVLMIGGYIAFLLNLALLVFIPLWVLR